MQDISKNKPVIIFWNRTPAGARNHSTTYYTLYKYNLPSYIYILQYETYFNSL